MIQKISRKVCLVKYRKLPLFEFDKRKYKNIEYYPEIVSLYWLKFQEDSSKKLIAEINKLLKVLNIKSLIFLNQTSGPWISKQTASRKDYKKLIKTLGYFKSYGIAKKFNGGVSVSEEDFESFILNYYIITACDSGFFHFNFTDENQNFIFYLHYSGDIKISILNEETNQKFLKAVKETKFIDLMRDDSDRIV